MSYSQRLARAERTSIDTHSGRGCSLQAEGENQRPVLLGGWKYSSWL